MPVAAMADLVAAPTKVRPLGFLQPVQIPHARLGASIVETVLAGQSAPLKLLLSPLAASLTTERPTHVCATYTSTREWLVGRVILLQTLKQMPEERRDGEGIAKLAVPAFGFEAHTGAVVQIEINRAEILLVLVFGVGSDNRGIGHAPGDVGQKQPILADDERDFIGVHCDRLHAQHGPYAGRVSRQEAVCFLGKIRPHGR
jgi:hypothetical protein